MMRRSVILLLSSMLLSTFTGFVQHAACRNITLYQNPAPGKLLQESDDEPNPEPAPEPPSPEPAPEPPAPEPSPLS